MCYKSLIYRSYGTRTVESLTVTQLPDMERLLAHLYSSSGVVGRNVDRVVLYEDAAKKQLQEFIAALHGC